MSDVARRGAAGAASEKCDSLRCENLNSSVCPDGGCSGRKSALKTGERSSKRVSFPDSDGQLVTGYLEPVDPWQDVGDVTAEDLVKCYLDSCAKHSTEPIHGIVDQIKSYGTHLSAPCPQSAIHRLPRLRVSGCALGRPAADALESVLKRVQFDRLDFDHCTIDDDTAVSLFDMIEYYESAVTFNISGSTDFGIRGWQACSRMIKKSQRLRELEARGVCPGEAHSAVLGRALRANDCRLRALRLPRANLSSRPLLCLVSALKQNTSIRELQLCDNGLGAEDAEQLGSLLAHNTTLQLLDISNNDIQDVGLGHITDGLVEQGVLLSGSVYAGISGSSSSSPSSPDGSDASPLSPLSGFMNEKGLAVLVVWNNNLTRNCANHLSRALTRSRSLCVLNVGQNALGSEAVRSLSHALRPSARDTTRETALTPWQPPALLCLGLQAARLGAPAAVAVADVLRENNVIQRIDLRDNRLQLIGLQALAAAMDANVTASQIDLDDVPPAQDGNADAAEMCRLCMQVRDACRRNEAQRAALLSHDNRRRRRSLIAERKISLTCQTLYSREDENTSKPTSSVLEPTKRTEKGRLRSPLPSPVPSPISSPVPSPSRARTNRFHVSRVNAESPLGSDRSSTDSSSPSTPTQSARQVFFGASRFKVVQVSEISPPPPMISVQPPTEATSVVTTPSRFSVTRNMDSAFDRKPMKTIENVKKDLFNEPQIQPNPMDKMVSITEEFGNVVQNLKDMSSKAKLGRKNCDLAHTEKVPEVVSTNLDDKDMNVPMSIVTLESKPSVALKKNKSESSLDSPDLEVSRYMHKQKQAFYDSNSSLDVSGSSIESLNSVELHTVKQPEQHEIESISIVDEPRLTFEIGRLSLSKETEVQTQDSEYEDVFPMEPAKVDDAKAISVQSESLLTSQGSSCNVLHSSISSNESVSPNIFGKNFKLHGSLSSLEVSMNSLDSYKSSAAKVGLYENLLESTDSGFERSESASEKPTEAISNESTSSNEGTLTYNSPISDLKSGFSSASNELQMDSVTTSTVPADLPLKIESVSPKRTSSLLDVPSMNPRTASSGRVRKISWIAPSASFSIVPVVSQNKPEVDIQPFQNKGPSSLEKLLSLFQHPSSIFSRSSASEESDRKGETSTALPPSRRDSQNSQTSSGSGSFWSWGIGSHLQQSPRISRDESVSSSRSATPENVLRPTPAESSKQSIINERLRLYQDSQCSEKSEAHCDKRTNPSTNTSDKLESSECELVHVCDSLLRAPSVTNNDVEKSSTVQNEYSLDLREHTVYVSGTDVLSNPFNLASKVTVDLKLNNLAKTTEDCVKSDERYSELDTSPAHRLLDCINTVMAEDDVCLTLNSISKELNNTPIVKSSPTKQIDEKEHDIETISNQLQRPRTFASVLKQSTENCSERLSSPETGPSVANLPSKVIKGIKENVSPENTLTSSMTNTKALADELQNQRVFTGTIWETSNYVLPLKTDANAETVDMVSIAGVSDDGSVDIGNDALILLTDDEKISAKSNDDSVMITTTTVETVEYTTETKVFHTEKLLLKKASSTEGIIEMVSVDLDHSSQNKSVKFGEDSFESDNVFEAQGTPPPSLPKDIPKKLLKHGNRKGRSPSRKFASCSPKSLPDTFSRSNPCCRSFNDTLPKAKKSKKHTVSSLGKMARDSLYALNMSEEDIAEFKHSGRLTSVESLRSLESVSEDAPSHSGHCIRTSQESLMSLDSISEDGRSTVSEGDYPFTKTKDDIKE